MTVYLVSSCPEDACTVDVTPRHCKQFKPTPGDKLTWTSTDAKTGKVVQSGTIAADRWGLVTLKELRVTKNRNRLVIQKVK